MLNTIYENLQKPSDYVHQESFLGIRLEVNYLLDIQMLIKRPFLWGRERFFSYLYSSGWHKKEAENKTEG